MVLQQKEKKEKDGKEEPKTNKRRRTDIREFEQKWIGTREEQERERQRLLRLNYEPPLKKVRKFEKLVEKAEDALIALRDYALQHYSPLENRLKGVESVLRSSHACYRRLSKVEYILQDDDVNSDMEDGLGIPFTVARQDESASFVANWLPTPTTPPPPPPEPDI